MTRTINEHLTAGFASDRKDLLHLAALNVVVYSVKLWTCPQGYTCGSFWQESVPSYIFVIMVYLLPRRHCCEAWQYFCRKASEIA